MQPEARASAPVALFGGDWEHSVTMPLGGTRLRDLRAVFPAMPERVGADGVRALVSLQRTGHDLVARGPGPAAAKEACFGRFSRMGRLVCRHLRQRGAWADMSDPASGAPLLGRRGGATHADLELVQWALRYPGTQVGSCCVVAHPSFGTAVYPAILFFAAPLAAFDSALQAAVAAENALGQALVPAERTSMTGIFIVPPRPLWRHLDPLRQRYFDNLRMGPHLSIVEKFVDRAQLDRGINELTEKFAKMPAFRLRFRQLDILEHRRSATVYAVPEDTPPGSIQQLARELARIFPQCASLLERNNGTLLAHMSVAKVASAAAARQLVAQLQGTFDFEFDCRFVQVCERLSELGSGEPFILRESFPITGDDAAVPDFGFGSAEYDENHVLSKSVLVSALDSQDPVGNLASIAALAHSAAPVLHQRVLKNPEDRNRCQGLLEFSSHASAVEFIETCGGNVHVRMGRELMYP